MNEKTASDILGFESFASTKDVQRFVNIWNENSGEFLPKVSLNEMTPELKRAAQKRWDLTPDPLFWTNVVKKISSLPYFTGRSAGAMVAHFNYLVHTPKIDQIMAGKFDERRKVVVSGQSRNGAPPEIDRSKWTLWDGDPYKEIWLDAQGIPRRWDGGIVCGIMDLPGA